MRMPIVRGQPGFTLVELMVTLAVATVLVVIAVPSFVDFLDKVRLKGVAHNVVDLINDARTESVKQGRAINVRFVGTSAAWCVGANAAAEPTNLGDTVPDATPCDCTSSNACIVGGAEKIFPTTLDNGVTVSETLPLSFKFDSRLGTVDSFGTTTVTLSSPRKRFDLQLTVTPLGQVSLCVPNTSKLPVSEYSSC